jgi:hypothetical protein
MAERMLELVNDPVLCRDMGANARAHIKTHFSMDRHIGCLQQIVDLARGSTRDGKPQALDT